MSTLDTTKQSLKGGFDRIFGSSQGLRYFSAPGRSELGGNHTDHNGGRVIAAAISLLASAAVRPIPGQKVRLFTQNFNESFELDLTKSVVQERDFGTSLALVRGVAEGIRNMGFEIGGLEIYVSSSVLPGSGLSSSAAFEVLIARIFNNVYCKSQLDAVQLALIAQYAENVHFGKPCGLMDQLASSVGGIITIDFKNPSDPHIEKLTIETGPWNLVLVNTGGSHANLTEDYGAIREEMSSVAKYFGERILSQIDEQSFYDSIGPIRSACGDRAVLRAIHFFEETRRAQQMRETLVKADMQGFFELVKKSGDSSVKFLQNGWTNSDPAHQGIVVALALSDQFIASKGLGGVARLHGGGFAGTIQAWIHDKNLIDYCQLMDKVFGEGASIRVNIRNEGSVEF